MLLKLQLVKCVFCVILYLLICLLLLWLKKKVHIIKSIYTENNNETGQRYFLSAMKEADSFFTTTEYEKSINLNVQLLSYNKVKPESNYKRENKLLLARALNTCMKYELNTPIRKQHFSYSSKHKSLYCWIRKVASTTFTTLFSNTNVDSLVPHNLKELQQLVNNSDIFKLLVVRHPFERLVSSYRDRIEDNTKYTAQAWIYVQKIYHFTRPNLFYSNTTTGNSLQKIFTHDRRLKIVPTFKEFIEWLLQESPENDDVHWSRYYSHCAVCNISYSFILKLDYYAFDQINYIFSRFGIDENTTYLPNLKQTKGGYTNFELTCKYFRNLTHSTIFKLYERYKIDFKMYNYELDKYLRCKSEVMKT